MKKVYEKPLIEIEEFEVEDILTLTNEGAGSGASMEWLDITQ